MPGPKIELLNCICRESANCVKVNECLTSRFEVSMGLCQGCLLSPIHCISIYDLPTLISDDLVGGMALSSLMFSLSWLKIMSQPSKCYLMKCAVGAHCAWDINVNSNKYAVIHFHQLTCPLMTTAFTLGKPVIPIAQPYTYTWVIVDEQLTFQETVQARI